MTTTEFFTRLVIALFAGLIIGFERQWHHKETGLKTNMLVATGAAAFVLLSIKVAANAPNIDVTRITAQVVMGVGFLGAGVIFREGSNVHGLNSAATIWCSAAIGCISASGYFIEALICTFLVIIVNTVLEPVEKWMRNRK
ncbi:MgtC/SapB family protein [Flavobacterium johnsoniae]|jgi:putative Mg2+ transporter-C (MgtC) family protein|uniref:MgtC/SapB transporter n=1 Tax=Flavobacterium johnsoniae (strain ATCC 17061 / DSM 2064 / JCM 8514 / BCRC 14874 / CCUG 350202 / NBRC 14942 / NCIMB 11054 / UW101) TaxID=376686 RepID=A5FCZ7_FLAJ1|nr:MgtC/SapB family protein [Flavobacterium johnsoniae]ABQ06926.1 MgtC/SapB transporter [Flavobacterium johnsoniae UW101]OXE97216.1 magnesium transporter MgtC [Flavobacterium johnsoniae UW101]WQG81241.1 MgtC/SapB family protein [Flavobacterium johnsoniae UW101]SHL36346.1 putative Mg2+ transporter-C (MgtC) family protein [Flavobacterium johnsoniae]